jgi:acyl-CoA synthetase (AMP-forming)/AMP-acid ligase II
MGPDRTILDRLRRHALERPDADAYRQADGARLTWGELAGRVESLAHWLAGTLEPGAVVILSSSNRVEYPVAFLGVIAAGCQVFAVSAEAAEVELRRAAEESGAVAAIGEERAVATLIDHVYFCMPIECVGVHPPPPVLRGRAGAGTLPISNLKSQISNSHSEYPGRGQCGLLLQSSGTTGLPKIARRSAASLDVIAAAMADAIRFTPDDQVLMTIPLTHSYGMEHGLLAPVWAGSCVHLCRGLDIPAVMDALAYGGITVFPGVPAGFEMLAGPAGATLAIPTLRVAYAAGAPLPRTVFDHFHRNFATAITQLYGATEIGSVTFNAPWELDGAAFDPASVGRGMRGVSIRILDVDANSPLPPNAEGQVAITAPWMFEGYTSSPAELIDGHYPTGDLGRLDAHGRLFLTGRLKLLIDVGGMKVNPLEVEAVLQRHPAVAACVILPVRQSATVHRIKAIIVPKDPATPPPVADLRRLAREHLAAYKVPRAFEFRPSLPRSPTGKVLRHLVESA